MTAALEGADRVFDVVYDEDLLRRVVRIFVWRRVVRRIEWILCLMLAAALAIFTAQSSHPSAMLITLAAVLATLPFAFIALAWRAHHVNTIGRFRRMTSKQARLAITSDGISVQSDLGSGAIAWTNVTEVWDLPAAYLLFSGPTQFNTIPKAALPPAAEAVLRAHAPHLKA